MPSMTPADQRVQDAAVLVPVYRDAGGEIELVLVLRTAGGVHGGQLAFPGGKQDAADRSLLDTALRETREEIGLEPDAVEILASLPPVVTRSTGFSIAPFLARIMPPPAWRLDEREIAEVVCVRALDLARPEARGETTVHFPPWPAPRRTPFYRVGRYQLWGATFRIVEPLLRRLLAGEWGI